MKKFKKPIIELKVNNWTKRSIVEQQGAMSDLRELIVDLLTRYSKSGIADNFTAGYGLPKIRQ